MKTNLVAAVAGMLAMTGIAPPALAQESHYEPLAQLSVIR